MYFCISYVGKSNAMPKGRKELSFLSKWKTNNYVPRMSREVTMKRSKWLTVTVHGLLDSSN